MMLLWLACAAPSPPPPLPPAPAGPHARRVAVLVGADGPDDDGLAAASVDAVAEALTTTPGVWRIARLTHAEATWDNLTATLRSLAARPPGDSHADDELLVLIVAHGEAIAGADPGESAALRLASADGRGQTVAVAAILDTLAGLGVSRRALILDSCLPPDTGGAPVSSLLLTSTAPHTPAAADRGLGGRYSRCLAEAIADGSPTVLAAHRAAAECLSVRSPSQAPQVALPWGPPMDLPLRPDGALTLLLADPARASTVRVDGAAPDLAGGVAVLPAGAHDLDAPGLSGGWTLGAGDVLAFVPDATGALAAWVSPPGVDPQWEEVGERTGLAALLVGMPESVVPVDFGGSSGGPGLLLTRRAGPPRYVANVAAAGEEPRYQDATDRLYGPPGPAAGGGGGGEAAVYAWDGRPSVCYRALDTTLACVADHAVSLPTQVSGRLRGLPVLADLDGDGADDLAVSRPDGLWLSFREGETWSRPLKAPNPVHPGPPRLLAGPGRLLYGTGSDLGLLVWEVRRVVEGVSASLRATDPVDQLHPGPPGLAYTGGRAGPQVLLLETDGRVRLTTRGPAEAIDWAGAVDPVAPQSAIAADLDLDGLADLLLGHRGATEPPERLVLRRPMGWWRVRGLDGLDEPADGQQLVADDLDSDGDLDVLVLRGGEGLGGAAPRPSLLYRSDARTRASSLVVDVAETTARVAGTTVELLGTPAAGARLDGGRRRGAAILGLGRGAGPLRLAVRWPDGLTDIIEEPGRFIPEGNGLRVQIRRAEGVSRPLLVDRWRVDPDAPPQQRVQPLAALAESTQVVAAATLGSALGVIARDREGVSWLSWLDGGGRSIGPALPAARCDWLQVFDPGALFAGCEDTGTPPRERPTLFPGPRHPSTPAPGQLPSFPRRTVTLGDVRWVAAANTRVVAVDARSGEARPALDLPAPPDAVSRSELAATGDGRILVLDTDLARVEVWRTDEPPTRTALVSLGNGVGARAWDPTRERWFVGTGGAIAVFDARTQRALPPLSAEGRVRGLGVVDGELWVVEATDPPQVRRVDPDTGVTTWRHTLPEAPMGVIAGFPSGGS